MKHLHDHPFHIFSRNICNAPQIGFDLRIFHLFFIFHTVFWKYSTTSSLLGLCIISNGCSHASFSNLISFPFFSSLVFHVYKDGTFGKIEDKVWYPTSPTISISLLCLTF